MSKEGIESNMYLKRYQIIDGKLARRVEEGTEKAFSHVVTKGDKTGDIRWYYAPSSVEGMITGGGIVLKEFAGKKVQEININLDNDAVIQLPMQFLSAFAKPAPNINLNEPIKFSVYKSKKGKQGLNISQGGKKVEWYYTKNTTNGLPQPTHDDIDGWDFRDHDKFLKAELIRFFDEVKIANGNDIDEQQDNNAIEDVDSIPF